MKFTFLFPFLFLQNSLLWQIDGKGYLFGTMHEVCEKDYRWTAQYDTALIRSNILYLELDINDKANMIQATQVLYDTTGRTISSYFTPGDWQKVSSYITDSLDLALNLFDRIKPLALYVISQSRTHCKAVSYEERITDRAKALHLPVKGLETSLDQIELLNSVPVDSMVKEILDMVTGRNDPDSIYNALATPYRQGNVTALYFMSAGLNDRQKFIDDRNRDWLPAIESALLDNRPFIAVGAAHLYGLIWSLRAKGHQVTAVSYQLDQKE